MPAAAHRRTQADDRVVLLIDLDCFYAQCECRRLGFDATATPLALLQWNSVLAVTYPARERFGIKRGDSWEEVRRKSQGECLAVHVPILSHAAGPLVGAAVPSAPAGGDADAEDRESNSNEDAGDDSPDDVPFPADVLDEEYDRIFGDGDDGAAARQAAARRELGVRRFSQEGKACIERYRIASRRILGTILAFVEALNRDLPPDRRAVLERASIDEIFLDVSGACASDDVVREADDDFRTALEATIVIGGGEDVPHPSVDGDAEADSVDMLSLQRGVVLASRIRKLVRDKLNFTMTAGIGQNKTIAKLSASYGKPNGQAVTNPSGVGYLLQKTEIRKCRNFGGKLGKRVQALLPPDAPTTMGSIARYLSLPDLESGLGDSGLARWVYHAARGIDAEAVIAKEQSLMKSITAFKSLPFHAEGHTIQQAEPWIRLLAQEVVKRVEQDTERNNRYPKSLNIHYAANGWGHQKSVSIRIDFPSEWLSYDEKINALSNKVPTLIMKKAGPDFKIHRVGLCAESFVVREKVGKAIHAYFAPKKNGEEKGNLRSAEPETRRTLDSIDNRGVVVESKTKDEQRTRIVDNPYASRTSYTDNRTSVEYERDLEYARALQQEYDRERRMLETLERRDEIRAAQPKPVSKKKRPGDLPGPATKRLDTFFQKR